MGKAGRVVCIFTPMALTIASFVCLVIMQISGWPATSLNQYYYFQANFTGLDIANAPKLANTTDLTAALTKLKASGQLKDIYQIHLWNYCTSQNDSATTTTCTAKENHFVFDPIAVWQLNATSTSSASPSTSSNTNAFQSAVNNLKNSTETQENAILGSTAAKAFEAYRTVANWMWVAYLLAFWTTLAVLPCGILAIFSRWGSFLTWIFSFAASVFTICAAATSTILFGALAGALEAILHPYGVDISLGYHALATVWLAVAFSWGASLFWLFSICCCSGRSNPHHYGNKGGLMSAEDEGDAAARWDMRGRGLRAEKTGSGSYNRLNSPYVGNQSSEQVPLQTYPHSTPYTNQNPWGVR